MNTDKKVKLQVANALRAVADVLASLKIAYHVSQSKNDSAIRSQGLKADAQGRTYVWGNPKFADWFFDLHESDGHQMSMWAVDVNGLPLSTDPETEDMSEWGSQFTSGESGEGYIHKGAIGPERILQKVR